MTEREVLMGQRHAVYTLIDFVTDHEDEGALPFGHALNRQLKKMRKYLDDQFHRVEMEDFEASKYGCVHDIC